MWVDELQPRNLADVVGQVKACRLIRQLAISRSFPKLIQVCGPTGVGRKTLARILTKTIQCSECDALGNPCLSCEKCTSPILEVYGPGIAPSSTITLFHDIIPADLYPQEGQTFIYTTDAYTLLPGVLGQQVFRIPLETPSFNEVLTFLKKVVQDKNVEIEEAATRMIVEGTHGNIFQALRVLEKLSWEGRSLGVSDVEPEVFTFAETAAVKTLMALASDWSEVVAFIRKLSIQETYQAFWLLLIQTLLKACLVQQNAHSPETSPAVLEIARQYGNKTVTSYEWLLGQARGLKIMTQEDLLLALVTLRERLGIVNLTQFGDKKVSIGVPRRKQTNHHLLNSSTESIMSKFRLKAEQKEGD